MENSYPASILRFASDHHGLVSVKDLNSLGVPRVVLTRLVRSGQLIRLIRGLYSLPERSASEHESLVEVSSRTKEGVFCLMTALNFHHLTTQVSFEVWLALPNGAYVPVIAYPPLHVVRYADATMRIGVETHVIEGVPVRVFCVAKTVVDCFKYRNKIGLDIALEALHEAWRAKRVSMDDLWQYAKICRVSNVMRPYLESLF